MLTFAKIMASKTSHAEHYISNNGRTAETTVGGTWPARWRPSLSECVAHTLGIDITCQPNEVQLNRLLNARRADDERSWTSWRRVISAYDMTFHPEKTVTLAAVFAPTQTESQVIRDCIRYANDAAMNLLAAEIGWARKGKGGQDGADFGATAWLSVERDVSWPAIQTERRARGRYVVAVPNQGDPHLRVHNLIFNVVVAPDGRIGSLDTARLTPAVIFLIGAYFQAELAQKLRSLGINVDYHRDLAAVTLSDVDSRAVKLFSKRHDVIANVAFRIACNLNLDWDHLAENRKKSIRDLAANLTRLGRISTSADLKRWQNEGRAIGWKHEGVLNRVFSSSLNASDSWEAARLWAANRISEKFSVQKQLSYDWVRVFAARALIGTGLSGSSDIDSVCALLKTNLSTKKSRPQIEIEIPKQTLLPHILKTRKHKKSKEAIKAIKNNQREFHSPGTDDDIQNGVVANAKISATARKRRERVSAIHNALSPISISTSDISLDQKPRKSRS